MCEEPKTDELAKPVDNEAEVDETTGASPGTAQACDDIGLNSLQVNLERFTIKPPGQQ